MHTIEHGLMFWANTGWPPSEIAHRSCILLQHQLGMIAFLYMPAVLRTMCVSA